METGTVLLPPFETPAFGRLLRVTLELISALRKDCN